MSMVATKHRTVRVPDNIWDPAAAAAAENGETMTDVIRRALERYVKKNRSKA